MSGLPGRLLDTSLLRRSLAKVSSGIVPEARLDFMADETDFDDALGDFPTGLVAYSLLLRSRGFGEAIENARAYSRTRTLRLCRAFHSHVNLILEPVRVGRYYPVPDALFPRRVKRVFR